MSSSNYSPFTDVDITTKKPEVNNLPPSNNMTDRKNMYQNQLEFFFEWCLRRRWKSLIIMKTSAKRKTRLLLGCFEAKSETVLRYTSRLTSLIITSSLCNSGSVFNNKITKKEFILGLKSSPSQRIYESFYD